MTVARIAIVTIVAVALSWCAVLLLKPALWPVAAALSLLAAVARAWLLLRRHRDRAHSGELEVELEESIKAQGAA